jgi:hypothetical protein
LAKLSDQGTGNNISLVDYHRRLPLLFIFKVKRSSLFQASVRLTELVAAINQRKTVKFIINVAITVLSVGEDNWQELLF